jgi:hypothetical protein
METTPTNLPEFAHRLAELIGRPTELRPFVCDGSPLACRAFLVGYNPATGMDLDFWGFWTDQGFDRSRWFVEYMRERVSQPLKPGKKYRPKVSPTRRVIDWINEGSRIPLLETNLYARPTADMRTLTENDLRPFLYLLDAIKPRVIVAHGETTHQVLTEIGPDAHVLEERHFSRGWSREKAIALGKRIREFVEKDAGK